MGAGAPRGVEGKALPRGSGFCRRGDPESLEGSTRRHRAGWPAGRSPKGESRRGSGAPAFWLHQSRPDKGGRRLEPLQDAGGSVAGPLHLTTTRGGLLHAGTRAIPYGFLIFPFSAPLLLRIYQEIIQPTDRQLQAIRRHVIQNPMNSAPDVSGAGAYFLRHPLNALYRIEHLRSRILVSHSVFHPVRPQSHQLADIGIPSVLHRRRSVHHMQRPEALLDLSSQL